MLRALFYVCFGVGVGYTVISFLLGNIFSFVSNGLDVDVGDGVPDMDTGDIEITDIGTADIGTISPFKPVIIATFLTTFGGIGLLLITSGLFQWYLMLSIAAFIGLSLSYVMFRYVYVPLKRAENTSAVSINSLVGHEAKVTLSIPQGGFGKISYAINGNIYGAPAKSENGCEIPFGTNVEILYVNKNVFYVKQIKIEEEIINAYTN